jgi:hypothetical protein
MPKAFQTVGATIGRPHSIMLRFRPSSGEFATLCCRAATSRPYIPASRLCFKLQFIVLLMGKLPVGGYCIGGRGYVIIKRRNLM